jgi:hypothetical protein
VAQSDNFDLRGFNRRNEGEPPKETPVGDLSHLREAAAHNKVPLIAARKPAPDMEAARALAHKLQNASNTRQAVGRGRGMGTTGTSPRRSGAAIGGGGVGGVSPMTQSLMKAKSVMRAAMLGKYDLGELKDQVEDLQNDPNIDLNTFKGVMQEVVKQAQNTPAHTVPGGSVGISRGTGPDRMSQEAFAAGEERQQANLKPGETLEAEGAGAYKVKLPDTVQEPLPGGKAAEQPKPAPEAKESEYQKAQYESANQSYRQAEEDEKQAKSKLETGTDAEGNKIDPNDTNTQQWKDYQHAVQVAGQRQNEFLNMQKGLPGGPNAQSNAPTPAAAPTPNPQNPYPQRTMMPPGGAAPPPVVPGQAQASAAQPAPAPVAAPGIATPQSPAAVHPVTGAKYPEGSVLHSPSTGKMFKVTNGQILPYQPPANPLPAPPGA